MLTESMMQTLTGSYRDECLYIHDARSNAVRTLLVGRAGGAVAAAGVAAFLLGHGCAEAGATPSDRGHAASSDSRLFRVNRGAAVWCWMALAVIGGCRPTVLGGVDSRGF